MKVLVVKDGTVPVVVAKLLAETTVEEAEEYRQRSQDDDLEFEIFGGIPDDAEALDVTWADSMGFTVEPITVADWFKYRQEDEDGGPIEVVRPGEYVQSDISHGEDESWYSHLFVLRGF